MLLGKSLGSCPTAYLAAITLFRGVVLVGGIASGARVLWPSSRNPLSDSIAFNNLSKLKKCESLVQIIHGKQDSIIPHSAAEALHKVCEARHPLPLGSIEYADHDVELNNAADFLRHMTKFLQHVRANPPAGSGARTDALPTFIKGLRDTWTQVLFARGAPGSDVPNGFLRGDSNRLAAPA